MASSYLDLYTGTGGYYNQFGARMPKPAIGVQQGTYRAGQTERVVHDKYNNIYYGQQTQDQLIKGLQDAIARSQASVKNPWETRVINQGTIFQQEQRYKKSAQEIADMNTAIKNQQSYLKHIQGGGYKQESNQYYESYDAYTGDWNNVFSRRKSNADQTEKNRLQEIENEKTRVRNKKIEGQNQTLAQKEREAENAQITTGSKARAKKLTPNLEINTGISAAADKLVQSLNKTGLGI